MSTSIDKEPAKSIVFKITPPSKPGKLRSPQDLLPLTKGNTYVLLLQSKNTRHDAPWLINAIFQNVYPEGRHLGYEDDLFFSLSYAS